MNTFPAVVDDLSFLPPHEATPVPGFHAYSNQLRVQPGQTLDVRVSNDGPVDFQILKLGVSTQDTTFVAALPRAEATLQTIARGSYVHIENGLNEFSQLTVEIWFRTLASAPRAGLIGQSGVCEMWLEDDNTPVLAWTGSTPGTLRGAPVSLKEWHHVAARWNGARLDLWVDGEIAASQQLPAAPLSTACCGPLRLGALSDEAGAASAFFTGDICAPVIYERALADEEIRNRYATKNLTAAAGAIGAWKFDSVQGLPYRDESPAARHGQPVNYPVRMIPGPRRTHDSDWLTYDPTQDPDFGYAIRLMADDIVDCRWPITATWTVPQDVVPGQYGCRATDQNSESRDVYFIVRPTRPRAKMLCLSTTSTRVAYNFQPFDDVSLDYGAYQLHPIYPMLAHIIGARRPNSGEPWERQTVDFELPFYAWLDREGIDYDLMTEWDIEEEPALLDAYEVVAFAGHSEYWTARQYESLQAFTARGGHLLSMSGNTAYWRVSVDPQNAVIEVRKHARMVTAGTDFDAMHNAAHWHQIDLLPGATLREGGWPEHGLIGNVTNGSTNPPLNGPLASYAVLHPQHPLFHEPRVIDTNGKFAIDGAGYETDLSSRSMLEFFGPLTVNQYPPRDGSAPPRLEDAFDAGTIVLARAVIPESNLLDYNNSWYEENLGDMFSEIVLWERPAHGLVFSTGSVLSCHSLLRDDNFSNFMLNVLDRMGVIKVPQ